jgi:hypothetical protein
LLEATLHLMLPVSSHLAGIKGLDLSSAIRGQGLPRGVLNRLHWSLNSQIQRRNQ